MASGNAATPVVEDDIAALKARIRAFLNAHFHPAPSKTQTSRKVHLEVWDSRHRQRSVGVELGHKGLVNFWVIAGLHEPKPLPTTVERVLKKPKSGGGWTDPEGDGANSNLKAYDQFRGASLARLTVTSWEDARLVLENLA